MFPKQPRLLLQGNVIQIVTPQVEMTAYNNSIKNWIGLLDPENENTRILRNVSGLLTQ